MRFDVVIVGTGIAGIYSALHIDPKYSCAVLTKGEIGKGSSFYAQGGIAAVTLDSDSYDSHIEDTLTAGAGLCDYEAVKVLVNEGPENIRELVKMDVPFDVNSEGELRVAREGGHRARRILHCGGDATGRETTRRLCQIAAEKENIHIFTNTYLVDIITENGEASGIIAQNEKTFIIESGNIIIASGGIGQLYNYTTNPVGSVGDGIAAAYRAGAVAENMEMVQFHPTTLIPQYESDRLFLISEAVRGEGGILKNRVGTAFMRGVHPMADLAPRDIVTRAVYKELRKIGDSCVFLDVSHMTREFFSERFPTIYGECIKFNINVPDDYIPVRPAQHYHMGGIKTDLNGMTCVKGLYACGEAASTGIHGGNRLASNSMLECLVFGRRCAHHINNNFRTVKSHVSYINRSKYEIPINANQIQGFKTEIKTILSLYAGAVRNTDGMLFGLERVNKILDYIDKMIYHDNSSIELYNMVQTASLLLSSAIMRKENAGAHYVEEMEEPLC